MRPKKAICSGLARKTKTGRPALSEIPGDTCLPCSLRSLPRYVNVCAQLVVGRALRCTQLETRERGSEELVAPALCVRDQTFSLRVQRIEGRARALARALDLVCHKVGARGGRIEGGNISIRPPRYEMFHGFLPLISRMKTKTHTHTHTHTPLPVV